MNDPLVRLHRAHHIFHVLRGIQARGLGSFPIVKMRGRDTAPDEDGQQRRRAGVKLLLPGEGHGLVRGGLDVRGALAHFSGHDRREDVVGLCAEMQEVGGGGLRHPRARIGG